MLNYEFPIRRSADGIFAREFEEACMGRKLVVVVATVAVLFLAASPVFAKGGMPAAHGVDGRTFGGVVSGLALTNPLALAEHVSGCR